MTRLVVGGIVVTLPVALILPSVLRVREFPRRIKCASNLHQIGLAILDYANEHYAQNPVSIDQLLTQPRCPPEVFICPSSNDESATGSTPTALLGDFNKPGHCSYIYLGLGTGNSSSADTVILYEPLSNHGWEGMNVLFGDGHAEWFDARTSAKLIAIINTGVRPVRLSMIRWSAATTP